jgi:hypothetical protein
VKVALPEANVEEASTVEPFMNFTAPVGTPTDDVTLTVNVTDCPEAAGFCDVWRYADGEALFTI